MAQEMKLTAEETEALDRVEKELTKTKAAAAATPADLCKKYRDLRPSIEIVLKLVKKIPGIGGKIATTLEFLMGLADVVCAV